MAVEFGEEELELLWSLKGCFIGCNLSQTHRLQNIQLFLYINQVVFVVKIALDRALEMEGVLYVVNVLQPQLQANGTASTMNDCVDAVVDEDGNAASNDKNNGYGIICG